MGLLGTDLFGDAVQKLVAAKKQLVVADRWGPVEIGIVAFDYILAIQCKLLFIRRPNKCPSISTDR